MGEHVPKKRASGTDFECECCSGTGGHYVPFGERWDGCMAQVRQQGREEGARDMRDVLELARDHIRANRAYWCAPATDAHSYDSAREADWSSGKKTLDALEAAIAALPLTTEQPKCKHCGEGPHLSMDWCPQEAHPDTPEPTEDRTP